MINLKEIHRREADEENPVYYADPGIRTQKDEWKDFMSNYKYPLLILMGYLMLTVKIIIDLWRYVKALQVLDRDYLPHSMIGMGFCLIFPISIWICSTMYDFWNFHHRKIVSFKFVIFSMIETVILHVVRFFFLPVIRLASLIPINNEITVEMVVSLIRAALILIAAAPTLIACYFIFCLIDNKDTQAEILYFKVLRGVDLRDKKEFKYDFTAVTRMEDGKPQVIQEKDRQLHMMVSGATGTAKTSTVLIPMIAQDLDQKRFNENYQKKCCKKAVREKVFYIKERFDDKDFSINYFAPIPGKNIDGMTSEEYFRELKLTSSSAGMTIVAPNASFADDVYKLAVNRGFKVNRIDPILDGEEQKKDFIGMNPLYVSPSLTGIKRDTVITNNAGIFADVLKALFDMSGSADTYFVSVNNSITINVCKLLMLTYEDIHGRQPNAADVQRCIDDFNLCRPYLDKLVEKYNTISNDYEDDKDSLFEIMDGTRAVDCGIWQDVYSFITTDMLGPELGPKMFDHASGLRLQINTFLNHPLVRRVLCADNTIDIDRALENGEITIVNYALELGQSVSRAFGLFFLQTYSKAVLRRPGSENDRVPHFTTIDELPVLLHPVLEEFFSLHRQYRACNTVALQTLDQLDKDQSTKFMKSVLEETGHQVLFGRMSAKEMEEFCKMAGKIKESTERYSETETSITSENPMHTFSKQTMMTEVDYMSPTDMRYREFKEVTLFTTEQGTPLRGIHGKTNFLAKAKWKGKPAAKVNWEPYMKEIEKEPAQLSYRQPDLYVEYGEELSELRLTSGFDTDQRIDV